MSQSDTPVVSEPPDDDVAVGESPDGDRLSGDQARQLLWNRRSVLAALGSLGAIAAIAQGDIGGGDGNLHGGTMALEKAYKIGPRTYMGPDSAKAAVLDEIDDDEGYRYEATDTQVKYYLDDGAWQGPEGIGSQSEPVPSVHTDQLFTRTPTRTLAYLDGSETVTTDKDGEIARDTDAGVAINAALDAMSGGGYLSLLPGLYQADTKIETQNQGTFLVGLGSSWQTSGGTTFSVVIQATSNLTTSIYSTEQNFQGARHVAFDGNGNAQCVNSSNRDDQFVYCGMRGGNPNIVTSNNMWIENCLVEFPQSNSANIALRSNDPNGKIYITGSYIADGQKGIDVDDAPVADIQIKDNFFVHCDRSIQFSNPLKDSVISGNTHRGVGQNSDGSKNTVYYGFGDLENVRFCDEVIDGEDASNVQQTSQVFEIEGSTSLSGDVVFDVSYQNISGSVINNAAGVSGYVFNGRIPDPATENLGGSDGNIAPSTRPVEVIPVFVDAGASASAVQGIGGVNRAGQTVRLLHAGSNDVTLSHDDTTNGSDPLLLQNGGSDRTLTTNGEVIELVYDKNASKWRETWVNTV